MKSRMKIIAYYLPQFHEIYENNKWWGKGFTEWTNIKKAKKLYKDHNQPIVPLNKFYYNLMDKETVEWQTKLANQYGIEGFCYYHYWFKGRKILEKPAENLLKWKSINQKFCFCWANHSWKKTWNGTMEMLIEQKYGNQKEWEEHILYLLDFFKDERYIKIDNRPVFMIYLSKDIPNFEKRIKFYNEKCIQNGFDGIYIIESINVGNNENKSSSINAVTLREPSMGIASLNFFQKLEFKIKKNISEKYFNKPKIFKSNKIYKKSLEVLSKYETKKDLIAGGFAKWDSTPRHSKRGYIIKNDKIVDFENYLREQKKIMKSRNIEYMFFNAWNEWAEGMYLEPDEQDKYKYLEIIKKIIEEK